MTVVDSVIYEAKCMVMQANQPLPCFSLQCTDIRNYYHILVFLFVENKKIITTYKALSEVCTMMGVSDELSYPLMNKGK